jgi:methylated-DNA-[protein]-cysteine S-methyltransferase
MLVVRYGAGEWGVGELWIDGTVPVWHELPTRTMTLRPAPIQGQSRGGSPPGAPTTTLLRPDSRPGDDSVPELARRIGRYFAGEPVSFDDVEIDLAEYTRFQRAVADALRAVPYGETVTYGELAALAGHPNAQRAAGSFCAHNRLPLIFPCHRVVAAGGLGSYGSLGLDYKRRLLELEHVAL